MKYQFKTQIFKKHQVACKLTFNTFMITECKLRIMKAALMIFFVKVILVFLSQQIFTSQTITAVIYVNRQVVDCSLLPH